MGNPFVHVELATTDVGKAKSFYRSLFDWQLKDMDMGGGMTYTLIEVGKPVNLEDAQAVKQTGKAKTAFAELFGQVVAAN